QALTRDNLAAHRFRESLSAPRTPRANANGSACLCEGKRHSARAAASSDDQHSAATERDARFESAKDADVVRVVAVELASAADHHRIHGSDRGSQGIASIQMAQDRLLVGKCYA